MKKITMTLMAVIFFFAANTQVVDDWSAISTGVPKTETAPTLDGDIDAAVYTGDSVAIERWNYFTAEADGHELVGPAPIDGVDGFFMLAYDDEALYVYSELVGLGSKEPNFEVGLTVDLASYHFDYSYQSDPYGADGFVFSKGVFGGDGGSSLTEGEIKTNRLVDWFYLNTVDGYIVEARVPWADLSENSAAFMDSVMNRGVLRFDFWYKMGTDREVMAWSTNDNKSYRRTDKMGVIELLGTHVRKQAVVPELPEGATAPSLDGLQEDDAYTGEVFTLENWSNRVGSTRFIPATVEGVSSEFTFTYDEDFLFIVGNLQVPEDIITKVEMGVLVAIEPEDIKTGWQGTVPTDDGFLFSKAVFGTDITADAIGTSRVFDYFYTDLGGGLYEWEVRAPWDGLSSDPAVVTAFRERGTFFFDLGFKFNGKDSLYLQWSSNDNRFWSETFRSAQLTLGGIVSVDEFATSEGFRVYPNPAKDKLYIESASAASIVEVYNLLGTRVKVANTDTGSVDVSDLKDGIYMVRVHFNNGESAVRKFMKN